MFCQRCLSYIVHTNVHRLTNYPASKFTFALKVLNFYIPSVMHYHYTGKTEPPIA